MRSFLKSWKNNPDLIKILQETTALRGLPFWISAVITGVAAVTYAGFFKTATNYFFQLFSENPYWLFLFTPLGFLAAWGLVHFFAPNAKGSGIPQVLASIELSKDANLEKKVYRHMVSLPITLIKVTSSLITVLCGGAIGREGPTIQISAYIFHSIGNRFQKIWKVPQDVFFISGGAAGIAAAFNTPLGGIVYAIEELSRTSFHRFRTSLFTAVIVAGVIAQTISGPYLFIGMPTISPYSSHILPYAIVIGLISGLAGAFFGKLLYWVSALRQKLKSPYQLAALTIVLGLVVAAMIVFIQPEAATSGKDLIAQLLFENERSTADLVLVRFLAPILTYFGGAAGGIFSPALSAGASIGGFLADILSTEYRNTFILLGMIGFLSGFTAAPFTAFVLVLEMTDRHSIVLSMMLTSLTAYLLSQLISVKPFYERMKDVFVEEEKNIQTKEAEIKS